MSTVCKEIVQERQPFDVAWSEHDDISGQDVFGESSISLT